MTVWEFINIHPISVPLLLIMLWWIAQDLIREVKK